MTSKYNDRVRANTDPAINRCIDRQTADRVRRLAQAGAYAIEERLCELDAEWDFERYVETVAPSLTLASITLGFLKSRKFFAVPFLVQGFLLQHAIQGWCPPVPILRRLGVRTASEIDAERNALKALRGDFEDANMAPRELAAERALAAASK